MSSKRPITLHFSRQLCVAGGTVQGEVELNFPLAQEDDIEEVHVKLSGSVKTNIYRNNTMIRESVHLLREDRVLWRRGTAYPPPGSHTLSFPFEFALPTHLPPSFHFNGFNVGGSVSYELEVVGVRRGTFHWNRRMQVPLAVVPCDTTGHSLRTAVQNGWRGAWATLTREERVRKGVWGDHAHVKMILRLPDLIQFPLFTPIPFSIRIVSISKPMKRENTPEDKPIFPTPPQYPEEIQFELRRSVYVRAHAFDSRLGERAPFASGLTVDSSSLESTRLENVWIPSDDKEKGTWKQEVTFSSKFVLRCPPTFQTRILKNEYRLQVQLNFGGLFNKLYADFPIRVVSGLLPSSVQTDFASLSSSTEGTSSSGGNRTTLDLPP
ncbi:hypothetical protein BKA93DRAFT_729648 [Sparassis latifolia]